MRLVVIESPYAGKTDEETRENVDYAKHCVHDCLKRGEAPYASHLFFTQPGILDDKVQGERILGINAGFAWAEKADVVVVYMDRGMSKGMEDGIRRARDSGQNLEYRSLVSPLVGH